MDNKYILCGVFLVLLSDVLHVSAQTQTELESLFTTVTTNYKQSIRPNTDQSQPTNISVSFDLFKVKETDLPLGVFTAIMAIHASWTDPRITWTPASYGNANRLVVTKNDVWYPNFITAVTASTDNVFGDPSSKISFNENGEAYLTETDFVQISCSYDEKKYPFDEHSCGIYAIMPGFSPDDITLVHSQSTMNTNNYLFNPEWKLISTATVSIPNPVYVNAGVNITIKRREKHFLIINYIPLVLLSYLNTLTFKVPVESGRVGFAITCLLALAVYLQDITGRLPRGSQNMSYVSYYLTSTIVVSSFECMMAVFTCQMYFKDDKNSVPQWLQRLTYWLSWPPLCFKNCSIRRKKDISPVNGSIKADGANGNQGKSTPVIPHRDDQPVCSWKDVVDVLDNTMFCFSVAYATLSMFITSIIIAT